MARNKHYRSAIAEEYENAKEIKLDCKIEPKTNGKTKIWCVKFPDVYKFFVPPLPRTVLEEFAYDVKCAFLDKGIILRTDVQIILNLICDD